MEIMEKLRRLKTTANEIQIRLRVLDGELEKIKTELGGDATGDVEELLKLKTGCEGKVAEMFSKADDLIAGMD